MAKPNLQCVIELFDKQFFKKLTPICSKVVENILIQVFSEQSAKKLQLLNNWWTAIIANRPCKQKDIENYPDKSKGGSEQIKW